MNYTDFNDIPRKHYTVIYADPPWHYATWGPLAPSRQHYPTMSVADIANLPVRDIAAERAVLLIWGINPLLPAVLDVIKAWGFEYKTKAFCWVKLNKHAKYLSATAPMAFFTGMGKYTRSNPEDCWLATTAKNPDIWNHSIRQLVLDYRREHSRKPDIHRSIECLFSGPYIELFARRSERTNWDYWGNEL